MIARRSGDRWFVGAVFPGAARTAALPTSFLPAGNRLGGTTTHGSGGLVRTSRVVVAGQVVSIPVVADGGSAARLCAAIPGRTTCDV